MAIGAATLISSVGKRTYSVDEVREILGISRRKAYEICNSDCFKVVRVGRVLRISKVSFDNWLDNLEAMSDPTIDVSNIVFHSIRHTSAGVKLRLSGGDLKTVQGDGGWSTPDMVTKRYAHILDEDRRTLAAEMEQQFYRNNVPDIQAKEQAPTIDANTLAAMLTSNPELLTKVLQSIQTANNT